MNNTSYQYRAFQHEQFTINENIANSVIANYYRQLFLVVSNLQQLVLRYNAYRSKSLASHAALFTITHHNDLTRLFGILLPSVSTVLVYAFYLRHFVTGRTSCFLCSHRIVPLLSRRDAVHEVKPNWLFARSLECHFYVCAPSVFSRQFGIVTNWYAQLHTIGFQKKDLDLNAEKKSYWKSPLLSLWSALWSIWFVASILSKRKLMSFLLTISLFETISTLIHKKCWNYLSVFYLSLIRQLFFSWKGSFKINLKWYILFARIFL